MTLVVAHRPSPLAVGIRSLGKRASLVGCDYPLCQKALEFPVNLQSSSEQCRNDTIRYMIRRRPRGWFTDGRVFFCREHADLEGIPAPGDDIDEVVPPGFVVPDEGGHS